MGPEILFYNVCHIVRSIGSKVGLQNLWARVRFPVRSTAAKSSPFEDQKLSELTVIVPGNPGVDSFYDEFAGKLAAGMTSHHRVLTISHSNHVVLNQNSHAGFSSLDSQISDKLELITSNVSKTTKVNLIGHSIGAYMALKLAPLLTAQGFTVKEIFCLFPTIERMADSPNGRMFTKLRSIGVHYLIIYVLAPLVYYLVPNLVKSWLVMLHFQSFSVPQSIIDGVIEASHPNNVKNYLYMSFQELDTVGELDKDLLIEAADCSEKLTLYYGENDAWCPRYYGKELQELNLPVEIVFCANQCEHAFVINDSATMAEWMLDYIA